MNRCKSMYLIVIPHHPIVRGIEESFIKHPALNRKLQLFKKLFRECIAITGCKEGSRITIEANSINIALKYSNGYSYSLKFLVAYLLLMLRLKGKATVLTFNVFSLYVPIAAIIAKILRVRFITFFIQAPSPFRNRKRFYIHSKFLLLVSDFIAVNHPFIARRLVEIYGGRPILLIPNYVDDSYRDLGLERIPNSLLYVGRLSSEKRVDVLLKAIRVVASRIRNVKLFIVGNGPEAVKLKAIAKKLGITGSCMFLGWLDSKQVIDLYNRCQFFVFPSPNEYFPNVLLEAMACRTPIVTIENESYRWVINGAGVFCRFSSGDLANTIVDALLSKDKRLEMVKACTYATYRMKRILSLGISRFNQLINDCS